MSEPSDELGAATREAMEGIAKGIPGAEVPSDEWIRDSLRDHGEPDDEPESAG